MTAFTPDTIRNIGRYAGILPPQTIADRLGLALSFVERVAREQGFDLRIAPPASAMPQAAPQSLHPHRTRLPASERRHTIGITLRAADLDMMREKAAERFTRPAVFLAQIIEGAIARGKIDEMATAAKTYRPVNSDAESQVG